MLASDTMIESRRAGGITRTINAGLAHHAAGRLEHAETLYRKALRKHPAHPQALHLLGVLAYQCGHIGLAIELIEQALPKLQDLPDAHLNHGNALLAAGRPAEAAECYRRTFALQPDHGMAHCNLVRALNQQGLNEAALESAQRAVELIPDFPGAHANRATALIGLGRYAEAEAPLRRALELQPDIAEACDDLASVLTQLRRFDEATAWRDRAIELNPSHPSPHYGRGVTLLRMGDVTESEAAFRQAHALEPNNPKLLVGLGDILGLRGQFTEAVGHYRHALELEPGLPEANLGLAALGESADDDAQLAALKTILTSPALPVLSRVDAGFAAGMMLDRAERADEAFPCFAEANALFRHHRAEAGEHYDSEVMQREIDRLIERGSMAALAHADVTAEASQVPVFIVGMPRSGTSLIEQIAASHSRVHGAGELRDVEQIVKSLQPQSHDGAAAQWDPDRGRQLSQDYLTRLQAPGGAAARVIDKMPDNVFLLGAIALLFPAARVIICRRDLRDTCLSCYFRRFAEGNIWAYDLADCWHRAQQVERLADHWLRVLPNNVTEVVYEDVVADLEGESRRLIEFLGLDWEPACLDFHKTERPVLTASHWQVRQPLYARSVGRWRLYQKYLAPFFDQAATT